MLGKLKMNKIQCLMFVLLSALHDVNAHLQKVSRHPGGIVKRGLVFPPTSPTRHQLISGIGIPLELEDEAITLGIVLKAQYFLVRRKPVLLSESTKVVCLPQPETANQLKFNFFPDIWAPYTKDFLWDIDSKPFPNGRRRRAILSDPLTGQHYESYEGNVEQIGDVPLNDTNRDSDTAFWEDGDDEFDDQFEEDLLDKQDLSRQQQRQQEDEAEKSDDFDLSSSRWVAYDALSSMLQSKGFNGRMCVLRGICEAAEVQFSGHLMAELFHVLFTPSTTSEPVSKASDNDYIRAELLGRNETGPGCDEIFHQCKRSIIEIFTEVYDNPMFRFYIGVE